MRTGPTGYGTSFSCWEGATRGAALADDRGLYKTLAALDITRLRRISGRGHLLHFCKNGSDGSFSGLGDRGLGDI